MYMELKNKIVTFEEKSYSYIKSLLFDFKGFDKYILVEDKEAKEFIEYMLTDEKIKDVYIVIPIGGALVNFAPFNNTSQVKTA